MNSSKLANVRIIILNVVKKYRIVMPIFLTHLLINAYLYTQVFKIEQHRLRYFLFLSFAILIIFGLWFFLVYIIYNYKSLSDSKKQWIKFSFVYFVINFIILILVWPGVWRWDDVSMLMIYARDFKIYYWQTWLSGVIYLMSLAVLPFAAGVVIVQIGMISAIVGYICMRTYDVFNKKAYLLLGLMILPAIIDNNLYPLRPTLYGYMMLLLVMKILYDFYQKKQITKFSVIIVGILTGIVAVWRTEGILFFIAIPLFYLIFERKRMIVLHFLVLCICMIVSGSMISKFQAYGTTDSRYLVTAIIEPLAALVKNDFQSNSKEKDLEIIDKVLSVDMLNEYSGNFTFFNGGLKSTSSQDINNLLLTYVKIVIQNIPIFITERISYLLKTNGFSDITTTLLDSSSIFEYNNNSEEYWDKLMKSFCEEMPFSKPFNIKWRSNIIRALECRTVYNYYLCNSLDIVFYNVVPIVLILLFIFIYSIIKKWNVGIYWIGFIMLNIGLVVGTAPITMFMYYFPAYIVGINIIIFFINLICKKKD